MLSHIFSFRVRYAETDQMGVVYHGNYAQFFDIGRTEWLRYLGVTYKDMEKNGIMLPVISLSSNFKKSAYYDDLLIIKTILKKLPSVKIEFDYEITNQHQEIITTGSTVLAFMDASKKRPIRCPQSILNKITKSLKSSLPKH
ncbi:thioesterase family protein [Tenacibaculum maritimum]|uniref:acyl-CoA thioesterase n=1 Tax=Tenacibaculum maritimum TaxID=107401 RepID=UPI0012E6E100|nr:thioesterase family protein [Tenacibaculum maritimum]CAA0224098.1 Acyl-CoA thioester hydrolase [Tenacibaculum maritimum]